MTLRWRRFAVWLLAAAAVIISLHLLARHQLRNQLVREAVTMLGPLARGETPYRWQLGTASDLVGRRVFGDCAFALEADAVLLRAGSRVCEIGLTLRTPLDLRRFDTLTVSGTGTRPAFVLQVRERLEAPQYLAEVASGNASTVTVLSTLHWNSEHDTGGATMPPRAAMLRLRFADLTHDVRLRTLTLSPSASLPWPPPHAIADATWHGVEAAATADPQQPPLYTVGTALRAETLLDMRDRLRKREPAAVVVVREDIGRVAAGVAAATLLMPPGSPAAGGIVVALLFAVMLLSLRRPADARRRALLQAVTALALPLWLVAGLKIGDDLDAATQALIAVAVLYVAVLAFSDTARPWRWLGTGRAWLLATVAPLASLGLVLALGDGTPPAITTAAAAGYVLWALAQQYLIAVVFADRLRAAGLPAGVAVLAAATAFALLHTPNAALMVATFAGGLIWSAAWQRERSLLPLAVSHALAGLVLTSGLPVAWLRSAEVSLRYYL